MFSPAGSLNGLSEPIVDGGSPPKPPKRRRGLNASPITDIDRRPTLSSSSSRPVAIRASGMGSWWKLAGVVTSRRPLTKSTSVSVGSASTSVSPAKMGASRCLVRIGRVRRRTMKLPSSSV